MSGTERCDARMAKDHRGLVHPDVCMALQQHWRLIASVNGQYRLHRPVYFNTGGEGEGAVALSQSTASIGYTGLSVSTLEGWGVGGGGGGRLRQSNTSVIYTRPVCFNTGGKLHHTTVIPASAAHSPNSDEQGWETLTAYTCNYARPARKAHNMVCSTL